MSDLASTYFVVCQAGRDGEIETGDSFTLEELGGVSPSVGDLIADPTVPPGWARGDVRGRQWKEVKRRYVYPAGEHVGARVFLLVENRPADASEVYLLDR